MLTPHPHRIVARRQRGNALRGVMVLAVLAGALALQGTTPAWQSRMDALAASVGLGARACAVKPADAPSSTAGTGWRSARPSLVAGNGALRNPRADAMLMPLPASVVAPAI